VSRVRTVLGNHWPAIGILLVGAAISVGFLCVILRHGAFGLSIEDAYIYLTYAKQIGRGEPFTYFPGGGYSAGATSVVWPIVLAPFWTLGARGEALVWVSFWLCAALYAVTGAFVVAIVRRMFGLAPALLAGCLALGIAPFAFTALSGMEVAFASALLVAAIGQLLSADRAAPATKRLLVTLACLSLSRPESMLIVACVVGVRVVQRLVASDVRGAARWALPMLAPAIWVIANRIFAGTWLPNTGVAKSYFYLPGFDWAFWRDAVAIHTGALVRTLFWDRASPLVWPRLVLVLWLVGAVRILRWAAREQRLLAGALIVGAPLGLMFAVVASSGSWSFHNYRYIAPAFPLIMATAACALAPLRGWGRAIALQRGWALATAAVIGGFAISAFAPMRADMELYAQDVADLNQQVVAIGRYLHAQLPGASVMFHDAGAIAYYGDTRVYDMLGLITNHQARIANNGPGSRFEFLERLPIADRPTHFAYYPGWMGQAEFFGDVVMRTPLGPAFHNRRLIGGSDMQLIEARWDHAHTAEQPLGLVPGWRVVDRIDIADLQSEDAHHWSGDLGRRQFFDPTARWSFVHKQGTGARLQIDGGRTIRGGSEQFTTVIDPNKPVRVLLRTGGAAAYPLHERIAVPVAITLADRDGTPLGGATLPAPAGDFVEVAFDLGTVARATPILELHTHAALPYRVFHWFILQP
jgi:hypothetical protein